MQTSRPFGEPMVPEEFKQFRVINWWQSPLATLLTWIYIIAVFAVLYLYPMWWMWLLLAPILGAFQNRLTILTHDSMHRSLHPNPRISDFIGKWLCAYPTGNFFHVNIILHMHHHHEFGQKRDPFVLTYTISKHDFLFHDVPKAICGLNLLAALFNCSQRISNKFKYSEELSAVDDAERVLRKQALIKDYVRLPLVQLAMLSAAYLAGMWWAYFYFVIVRVTLCAAFNTLRLYVDHHSDVSDATPILANTADPVLANISVGWLERFFFAPLNINLHGTHHVAPYVPYYQLPKLTNYIREQNIPYFVDKKGYFSYLFGKENHAEDEKHLLPIRRRVQNFASEPNDVGIETQS